MPDPTTNFGWDVPTVGGSNNAWGTILNTAFDAVDADLKAVKTASDAATTNVAALQAVVNSALAQQTIYVSGEVFQPNNDEDDIIYGAGSGAYLDGDENGDLFAALPPLPSGAVLNEIHVYLDKLGNSSVAVSLIAVALDGVPSVIKTASATGTGVTTAAMTAIAHTVGANFLKVKLDQIGSARYRIYGMKILYDPAG